MHYDSVQSRCNGTGQQLNYHLKHENYLQPTSHKQDNSQEELFLNIAINIVIIDVSWLRL